MLTHFIVASDVDRTRRFYADVLGGEVLREGEPSIVALASSWIVINVGDPGPRIVHLAGATARLGVTTGPGVTWANTGEGSEV